MQLPRVSTSIPSAHLDQDGAAEAIPPSLLPNVSLVWADFAKIELSPDSYDVAILSHSS